MIQVSAAFKQELFSNRRNFVNRVDFRLVDGTKFSVDNVKIWNGGLSMDDAISEDDNFSALGAANINSCNITLYNNADVFSDYTFKGARATVYTGLVLPGGTTERIKKGTFTVDTTSYTDTTINLYLLDFMEKFDRPYTLSRLKYPATLGSIVRDCCNICGVQLNTNSLTFPHYTYVVLKEPDKTSLTFRNVISWCATIAGCYARCDADGKLEFKWFNTSALEEILNYDGGTFNPWTEGENHTAGGIGIISSSGTTYYPNDYLAVTSSGNKSASSTQGTYDEALNGGTFDPWTEGNIIDAGSFSAPNRLQYINALWTQNIAVDDVVITGVRISVDLEERDADGNNVKVYLSGTTDYCIDISKNSFITTDTANTVLGWLATLLIGLRFRKCNVTQPCDPTVEAGDVGFIWDTRGKSHPILITRVTFSPTDKQTVVCGAASPSEHTSTRFASDTRSFVELRNQFQKKVSAYDLAISQLQDDVANASGLYETNIEDESGAIIRILHDKREIENSDIQIRFSTVGIVVTANGTDENPIWYGLRVNGELIASIMNTIGINFDWGVGGQLIITRGNRETFFADADTGVVRIVADSFSLSSGDTIQSIAETKASAAVNAQTQQSIFNKLTNNGQTQGLYLYNGLLYINANYIQAGKISSANGVVYFDLDNNEISASKLLSAEIDTSTNKRTELYLGHAPGTTGTGIEAIIRAVNSTSSYLSLSPGGISRVGGRLGITGDGEVHLTSTGIMELFANPTTSSAYYAQVKLYPGSNYVVCDPNLQTTGNFYAGGTISCSGTKSRVVDTEKYQKRLLYCYEMATPIFGDIGESVLDEQGEAIIEIDDMFYESARTDLSYQVFLQKQGRGDIWVDKKTPTYFIVKGEPNLKFSWEIKAKQFDSSIDRFEKYEEVEPAEIDPTTLLDTAEDYINNQEEILYETA